MSSSSFSFQAGPCEQPFATDTEGRQALDRLLHIHPPEDAAKSPPILAFQRKRDVEIPWSLKDQPVNAIRAHFEKAWGVNPAQWDATAKRLGEVLRKAEKKFFRSEFAKDAKPAQPTPVEGYVVNEGLANRWYHLITPADKPIADADFQSKEAYETAWAEKIKGIELVFDSVADAQTFYTSFEEIDLRPAPIVRRYRELAARHQLAKATLDAARGKAATATATMVDRIIQKSSDIEDLDRFQNWMRQLEMNEYDARSRLERLASDAARLGYRLVIEDKEVAIPNVATKLQPGKLYVAYRRLAVWTQTVLVRPVWIFPWTWQYVRQVMQQIVDDYQEVDINRDLVVEKRKAWVNEGKQVYVFEQSPMGLVTSDGITTLREVMRRCGEDEGFRRTCVVLLPVYEDSLTGERMLAKYSVFIRPLPGIVPAMPPRLSIAESLSYRLAWKGTQLGELASSINLAPGEERQVTITKRFEQETTVTRASSSIFDISRAETNDLATEMENQTRQEQERSSNLQFSAKASGGWGPFSAEASSSGGTSSSLKNMSQALSKVAKKASQSVSQQNRQEVSTTSGARTTVSNVDETVAKIRNINQGRSLNLMFYRLYNKYEGGVFLEDLHFEVIFGVESIAGSGVHESRSYGLGDLPRMLEDFAQAGVQSFKEPVQCTELVLNAIEKLLHDEYEPRSKLLKATATIADDTETGRVTEETPSAEVLRLPMRFSAVALGAADEAADDRVAQFTDVLRHKTIASDKPIAPQELLVAAPGLYLDAVVGARPSTEPYSEAMRTEEIRMRQAEVFAKNSEALYQRAMAARLDSNGQNQLTGVLPDPMKTRLTLSVGTPLLPGDEWYLMVDGKKKEKVQSIDSSRHIVEFSWSEPQHWMNVDNLLPHVALVNNTGDRIAFTNLPAVEHDVH